MTVGTAERLAGLLADAGWLPRIEFAMHGEPTLNPELHKLIAAVRRSLPMASILLTTNGDPLRTHELGFGVALDRLFAAGLNTFALDDYQGMRVAPLARDYGAERFGEWYEYPSDPLGNPHTRQSPHNRRVVIIHDIADNTQGNHAHLSNHAGSAAPLDMSRSGERCALPFRELSVRWDGSVALCCNDWTGMFKLGNVNDVTSILQIWHHPAMEAARRVLYHEGRTFRPCRGCTHRTYRNGLLPDKLGKETAPVPTDDDRRAIRRALDGHPYTQPVRRPWEAEGSSVRGVPLPMVEAGHEPT